MRFFSQKKDRLRQEQLARKRLAARREKKLGDTELRQKEDEKLEEIIDKDNIVALQVRQAQVEGKLVPRAFL